MKKYIIKAEIKPGKFYELGDFIRYKKKDYVVAKMFSNNAVLLVEVKPTGNHQIINCKITIR